MDLYKIFFSICTILASFPAGTLSAQKTVCEAKLETINCPLGQTLQITNVLYGRTKLGVCNPFNVQITNLNCRSTQISTNSVTGACQGHSTCILTANNIILGEDPCPGVPKHLIVDYVCVSKIKTPTTQSTPSTKSTLTTTPTTTQSTTSTFSTLSSSTRMSTSSATQAVTVQQSLGTGAGACHEFLVSGTRGIPDSQLTASSQESLNSNPHRARLYMYPDKYPNGFKLNGGWTASLNDRRPYIQVKLNWPSIIRGIVTQGREPDSTSVREWVSRYKMEYSIDGSTWKTVKDSQNKDKVFIGNTDPTTPITHMLSCTFVARFVRISIIKFTSKPSMRFDLYGCPATTADLGVCPSGWKERPGSNTCYLITDQSDLKSWDNARASCQRQQGDLITIDSYQERNWLKSELTKLKGTQKLTSWWTGINNEGRTDNKNYRWTDGSQLNTNVLQWMPSEPNNAGGKEHCGTLVNDQLNDLDCDINLPYICEMKKYWTTTSNVSTTSSSVTGTSSARTPKVITAAPTLPTTASPTTAPYHVPLPGNGSASVTIGSNVFATGCLKTNDCQNKQYGDYASCQSCHKYLTCAPSGVFVRPCPLTLRWDDNSKMCVGRSSTCKGP